MDKHQLLIQFSKVKLTFTLPCSFAMTRMDVLSHSELPFIFSIEPVAIELLQSEVSEHSDENISQRRTPERFNRGSTMLTMTLRHVEWVGGPVPVSPGFPIEAFGNDGL